MNGSFRGDVYGCILASPIVLPQEHVACGSVQDSWPATTEKFQISGWNFGDQGSTSNQTTGGQSIILLHAEAHFAIGQIVAATDPFYCELHNCMFGGQRLTRTCLAQITRPSWL